MEGTNAINSQDSQAKRETLETSEQIVRFKSFLEDNYYSDLSENIRKGKISLDVDFGKLIRFDPELSEDVLESPEETLKAFEISVKEFDFSNDIKNFHIRFSNLPGTQEITIRDIRSEHLGKFLTVVGVVRQKSDVRPQVTTAKFECPSCGNVISVLQLDTKFKEPTRCGCGRKGKFLLIDKEMVDAQGIVLEESTDNLDGGEQPKRLNIFLKEDLVSPLSEKGTNPGTKIIINGIVKEIPVILNNGAKSTRYDLLVEANFIETTEEDFGNVQISTEEEKQILELSTDPEIITKLVESCAPSIYGYEIIKESLLCQMVGGIKKIRKDGMRTRGDMHILLIGDPGSGKSQLLKRMAKIAPKSRFVSGKGASGAGLTASVVKDEFMKGWSLEAGALVLASNGICMIDELDKMTDEDRSAMHEALEGQTITISKANIQATLKSETTVLAAANPKFGRFDPYETIAKQINLPPALISRFDLIFPIRDIPNKDKDDKMASFILDLHKDPTGKTAVIGTDMIKKYIAYAKQNISPQLTNEAIEEIKSYYLKMRAQGESDGELKSIPITARQLEGLLRLTEGCAKLRLSNTVTKADAKRAVSLLHYSMTQVGVDPETGEMDIDRFSSNTTSSERSKIVGIRGIIEELEKKIGKTIPIEDIIEAAKKKGMTEEKVEEAIAKLRKSGDVFEPRRGFIQRL